MEASAQRLDGTLFKKVNDYGNCPICNVPFGNNIANHICGMKHCKNVRYAVNFTMPRSSAEQCRKGTHVAYGADLSCRTPLPGYCFQ